MYVTFFKGDNVKVCDEKWKDALIAQGWSVEGGDVDRDALKAEAESLGLKVHHMAKADTIAKLIEDHKNAGNSTQAD